MLRSPFVPPTGVSLISCGGAFSSKAYQSTGSGFFLSNVFKARDLVKLVVQMLGRLAGTSLWMDVDQPNDEMAADKQLNLAAR